MSSGADAVANPFLHRSAAQRYAAARPYFHPLVMQRIVAFTGISRFARALDVACGTGQSSRALAEIAEQVDAIDASPEMIAAAGASDRIHYRVARAEALPFEASQFELVTIGLAFHWVDQEAFLSEAHRVLKDGGWLVGYTSGFKGEMAENFAFRAWARETYPRRFPAPARRTSKVTADQAARHGFELRGEESFAHEEVMTAEQLTAYLLTQTNLIAAVEKAGMPLSEAADWILAGVAPFFGGGKRTMKFEGSIWCLQRARG